MRRAILALLLASACGGTGDPGVDQVPQPIFSDIQAKIFSPSCAAFSSCHSSLGLAGRCDLTAGKAYADLVGRPSNTNPAKTLVVPGHPEQSFLIAKLRGQLGPGEGERMPLHNPPLSEATINAIEDWIAAGAQQD